MVVNFIVAAVKDFIVMVKYFAVTGLFIVTKVKNFAVTINDFVVTYYFIVMIEVLIFLRFIPFRQTFSIHLLSYGLKLTPVLHYLPH